VAYIGKSKKGWNSWTYHHWEPLIGMMSKSNRNLIKRMSGDLGLQICYSRSMAKETITRRTKDMEMITNLRTTLPTTSWFFFIPSITIIL